MIKKFFFTILFTLVLSGGAYAEEKDLLATIIPKYF